MGNRLELHEILVDILSSRNVYYQPPENIKITYPAIVYSKTDIWKNKADDKNYQKRKRYDLIVIDSRPDNPVIEKLMDLPYCSYDRHYISDNLHHDSLSIYF